MMAEEKRMMVVVIFVLVLGFLSSIGTDFSADVARVYKQHVLSSLVEIIGAITLAIAHAIINVETGCFCCAHVPRQLNVNWTIAIATLICFRLSWFTFVAASLSFLGSAVFDLGYFGDIWKVKPCFFNDGSWLSFYCVCLDLLYYLLYSGNTTSSTAPVIPLNEDDIELGQPQLPPSNC